MSEMEMNMDLAMLEASSPVDVLTLPLPPPKVQPKASRKEKKTRTTDIVFEQTVIAGALSKKRRSSFNLQREFTFSPTQINADKVTQAAVYASEAEDHIQNAQNSLVQAAALLKSEPKRQTQLLDLIDIFRCYTTNKELPTVASIIAVQTNALEKVIRRVERATTISQSTLQQPQNTQPGSQIYSGNDPASLAGNSPQPTTS
jgi:hypothetical protein